ncbi:hypothetical protein EMPS_07554 [Entomortierella parvispora]|uniref:Uncharacterized protein n=1 Tax=Entomortierella parvispora TaxID=205924 RepID=A0A9P3HEN5_9FUNG|nr:hypothetical protein EMPS_07554 [Entomortierella parvispora]
MERTSATRLRFKATSTSSSKRKERRRSRSPTSTHQRSISPPRSRRRRSRSRTRSRSRSPRRKKSRKDRSSSPASPSSSSRRLKRSERYHVKQWRSPPKTFAPNFDDIDYEQELANARARDAQEEREAQEAWTNHLFDELANDDPFDYHSGRFEGQSQPRHQSSRSRVDVHSMDDERYADYMRKGMGRTQTQKADQEWEEWVQEQERLKHLKEKEESRCKEDAKREKRRAKKLAEEAEKKMMAQEEESPANTLRKKALVEKTKEEYERKWRLLLLLDESDIKDNNTESVTKTFLSWDSIPWPPLQSTLEEPPGTLPLSGSGLSLFDFLFFGTSADQADVRKQLLRREQLKFHPDKFRQRFGARLPRAEDGPDAAGEKDRILEMVDRVARALNEVSELL